MDVSQPDQWHDFFVMVGGSAAVLTGLVFVALSLNRDVIAGDASHRYRAIDTLAGMAAQFVICALVLMGGQDHRAVGSEWLLIATISMGILAYGYSQAVRLGGSRTWLRSRRTVVLEALYLTEVIGAMVLIAGNAAGLYLAAIGMVASLAFMITAAWLLVMVRPAERGPDAG